ncbi:MAG: regulator of cell morphogenesis and NO signaling [Cyclobacteriaceae bacterium]|jgi:regulator of cell morphogenesis and NO signaling
MRFFDQTISTIVDENYIHARALSYLGIEFYLHPNQKLGLICEEKGLVEEQVLRSFYLFDQNHRLSFRELQNYPLQIIVQYLKHSHAVFIKEKLPYIARLIKNIEGKEDLKLIFPDFIEEFINHIYSEEDTVFNYINQLILIDQGKEVNPAGVMLKFHKYSLKTIHSEHLLDDDMSGIRAFVEDISDPDLLWRVISNEIRAFDREMMYHAQIENQIMFPKAIALESTVNEKMIKISQLN